MRVPARGERTVAAVAAAVLAASGLGFVDLIDGAWEALVVAPPFLAAAAAVGIATARTDRGRARWIVALKAVMAVATACLTGLGLMMLVPGLVIGLVGAAYFGAMQHDDVDERAARVLIATGALWSGVFALVVLAAPGRIAGHVALVASLALAVAGLAWWRAIRITRAEERQPARAIVRRTACSSRAA